MIKTKITTKKTTYVQANDIINLSASNISIPKSMTKKTKNKNKFDFIKLNEEESKIVANTAWILDYDFLKNLSPDEINLLGTSLGNIYTSVLNDTTKPYEERCIESDFIGYKMLGLAYFLQYIEGRVEMPLPKGIEKPKYMKQEKSNKLLVKTIFN